MSYAHIVITKLKKKCASGFALSADGTQCIAYQDAIKQGSDVLAQHFTDAQYGWDGVVFYKNFNLDGTWDITQDTALLPDCWTRLDESYCPNTNRTSYTSGLWIKPYVESDTTNGIMNACAIWKQSDQFYVGTLGFRRTITVSEAKTYYIGLGTDNFSTVKVNGVTVLQQDIDAMSGIDYLPSSSSDPTAKICAFSYWHVYPIQLNAGDNTIEITTTNTAEVGSIATEIYNATLAQLQACTTQSDLTALTIFSSRNVANGDAFDLGSWGCADGFDLTNDSNGYPICEKIGTPPIKYQ